MVSDSLAMRSIVTVFVTVEIHGVFCYPDCLVLSRDGASGWWSVAL